MISIPQINDSTYYLGVNDRTKSLFENLWPLPKGVTYNSYLIKDEKNVLIDTVDVGYSEIFFQRLERILAGEPLHYLIVNHMEPDHSGAIDLLRHRYPEVTIVANKRTFPMLAGFQCVTDNLMEVNESTELNIGSRSLRFIMAPMVHWPEVMFTYDPLTKTLYSADAFGSFGTLDGGIMDEDIDRDQFLNEAYRYYATIVGKYGPQVQSAMKKVTAIEVETICSTHGPIWRKHLPEIVALYDRLSKYESEVGATIIYGSMYGNTEQMAEVIGRSLAEHGVKKVVLHHMSKSHSADVLADLFRYKGVVLGSPTYNMDLLPPLEDIICKVASRSITNKKVVLFGSGAWNCSVGKSLKEAAEKLRWETVGDPLLFKYAMTEEDENKAWQLGKELAEALLSGEA